MRRDAVPPEATGKKKGAVTLNTAPPLDHAGEDRSLRVTPR